MRLVSLIDRAVAAIGRAAAWLMFALVFLVAGNVFSRYLFSAGSVAAQELEWHLMVPIALIGMSYALRADAHVRVDVFYEHMGARLRAAVDLLSLLLLAAVAVILVRLSIPYVDQAYQIGEGSPDPGGLPHRFLLKALVPVGFGLLALQALAMAAGKLAVLVHARPSPPLTPS